MSTKNVTLHDENGNVLLPATKTSRVTDANGTNLDTLLQQAGQVKSISVNGVTQTIDANGNVNIASADGVGIASVVQTTTSSEDGGTNVITVTKTDNTTSTFSVKNGSKGSTGAQGPQGERGLPGESGVTGDVSGFTVIQTIDPSATYGATDIAGAATVQATNAELTELAGDVNGILDDNSAWSLLEPDASVAGWALNGTGTVSLNSSSRLKKYQVTAGTRMYLELSKDHDGVYQWQNNISVPSGQNNYVIGQPVTVAVDGSVTVPTGATYLIVSQNATNTTNKVSVQDGTRIGKIEEGIVALQGDIHEIRDELEQSLTFSSNAAGSERFDFYVGETYIITNTSPSAVTFSTRITENGSTVDGAWNIPSNSSKEFTATQRAYYLRHGAAASGNIIRKSSIIQRIEYLENNSVSEEELFGTSTNSTKSASAGSNFNILVNIDYETGDVLRIKCTGNSGIFSGDVLRFYYVNAVGQQIGDVTVNGSGLVFTASQNGSVICGYKTSSLVVGSGDITVSIENMGVITQLDSRVSEIEDKVFGNDFAITLCPTIFARHNNNALTITTENSQRYTNKIYPEGFVSSYKDVLTIDNGREYPVRTAYGTSPSTLKFGICKGMASKDISISVISTYPTVARYKKAMVLCIGESTTGAVVRNPYKNVADYCHGWPSSMQHFADIDNLNIGDINFKTIGTQGWKFQETEPSNTYTYNGQTYRGRSFNEGWGGWTIYQMLYWPSNLNVSNEARWYLLGLYTKTPYSQASYNSNTEAYTGSAEQLELLHNTQFLKYKVDCSDIVYEALKTLSASTEYHYPSFDYTDTYTGTAAQNAAITQWADELANNPINPFFDISKIRNNDDVAFSLNKYIERYRTLDNSGNRLSGSAGQSVVGADGNTYTIGTKVSSVNDYDVCTPTHIIFNMGINESVNNTVSNAVATIKKMMQQFTLPTAYFVTRIPGVCNPAMWPDIITRKLDSNIIDFHHNLLNELIDWFETQSNKWMLPVFHIQPPASVLYNFLEGNLTGDDGTKMLNASNSNIHPSYDAYRAIGWQCLNWVYYTFTL